MKLLIRLLALTSVLGAATVDGLTIHSTTTGSGPRTVILVHGWTCDETSWSQQAPALSAQYRVATLDLPGHGKSESPKDGKFTMELFARAVEAVRAELKADRVVLAGHSMGTPVIVQYARLYPDRVIALIFVDGRVTFGPNGPAKFDRERWLGDVGRKTRESMIGGMFGPGTTSAQEANLRGVMMRTPESTAAGAMKAYYDPAIWKNEILSIPTLAIYAQRAAGNPQAYLKEHFPRLEYHEIPGASHFLMLEKPVEFNRMVLDFLARNFAAR